MPTVLRIAGYRFYFYSHEPNEPPHVHVDCAGASLRLGFSRYRWPATEASVAVR